MSWQAIHHAAEGGYVEAIRAELDKGVKVDVEDPKGRTPLSVAAGCNYTEAMKLLISCNASLNKADKDGLTPLHHASYNTRQQAVKLLLEHKVDTTIKATAGF